MKNRVLVVPASFFRENHDYVVVCKATNKAQKVMGLVSREYNTRHFEEDFLFDVATKDGGSIAYSSKF